MSGKDGPALHPAREREVDRGERDCKGKGLSNLEKKIAVFERQIERK